MPIFLRSPSGKYLAIRPPTPPGVPGSLTAAGLDGTTIRLTWTAGSLASSYEVQRSADGSTGWATIATPAASPYDDAGLSAGATWFYRVRSVNAAGNSAYAGPVSGTAAGAGAIRAQHAAGQTTITRPDAATSTAGQAYRYNLYRSNAGAITAGNLASATLLQTYVPNNSGQVFGGKPDVNGGQAFTAANRIDSSAQMSRLRDGTQLGLWAAMATHTCTATEDAWYALLATDTSGNVVESVTAGVNSLASPVAEAAIATTYPTPIVWASGASSGSRGDPGTRITGATNLPAWLKLHASSASGGAPGNNLNGDYLEFLGDDGCGWREGLKTAWDVLEFHTSPSNQLWATTRDTMWATDWAGAFETWHMGAGFLKPGAGWSAPRFKMWQHRRLLALLDWLRTHYSCDPNRITITGQSMGGWGVPAFAYRYPSNFACIQTTFTNFQVYTRSPATWPVIAKGKPFGVTATTNPLGTDPAAVMLDDGVTPWGGPGGYIDSVSLISNATTDLPIHFAFLGRNDGYSSMTQFFAGLDALNAARQPYAAYWTNGGHDATKVGIENLLLDSLTGAGGGAPRAWATYRAFLTQFRRDRSYPAFSNATHDDLSTDTVGGRNVGWTWGTDTAGTNGTVTDTAGSWSAYIDNVYMDVTPAASWNSTTGSMNFGGPQHGPYTQVTADVTPVFRQSFRPSAGAAVNYSYTPSGGSPVAGTVTVDSHGRLTIPGVVFRATGPTLLSLS